MKIRKLEKYQDYCITEYGDIISYKRNPAGQTLKCGPNNAGYRTVTLFSKESGPVTESIHVLVAKTFSDLLDTEQMAGLELDHRDENKLNNHYSNLRWCTSSENSKFYHANNPSNSIGYVPVDPLIKKENLDRRSKLQSKVLGKLTGVSIIVNGKLYDALRQAARYIVEEEQKLGNIRNIETVRKELKRFTQGKRPAWKMYDRYAIGS